MSLIRLLRGTGVALVTPFQKNGALDLEAYATVIDHVINGGVDYVVVLGTTGETPTLNRKEKIKLIQFTYEKVAQRVPVVVGMGGNDTMSLLEDVNSFPLDAASAILSASPHYNKPSQEGLFQHYKVVAGASPKPVLLYNVPGRTGRNLSAATTLRLAREVPNIAGIKEAGGDMMQCMLLLKDRPEDFLVVSGDDALSLPQMACGMDGIISVAANAFPGSISEMIRLALHYRMDKAKLINDTLLEAFELMFTENNPAGVKAFMTEMGLLKNYLRLPLVPLSAGLHEKVKAYLSNQPRLKTMQLA